MSVNSPRLPSADESTGSILHGLGQVSYFGGPAVMSSPEGDALFEAVVDRLFDAARGLEVAIPREAVQGLLLNLLVEEAINGTIDTYKTY